MLNEALLSPAVWGWLARNWAAIAIAATCASLIAFAVLVLAKYVRSLGMRRGWARP